jgi:hypothetical protein
VQARGAGAGKGNVVNARGGGLMHGPFQQFYCPFFVPAAE